MPDVLPAYPYSELAHIRPGSHTGSSNESRKPIAIRYGIGGRRARRMQRARWACTVAANRMAASIDAS